MNYLNRCVLILVFSIIFTSNIIAQVTTRHSGILNCGNNVIDYISDDATSVTYDLFMNANEWIGIRAEVRRGDLIATLTIRDENDRILFSFDMFDREDENDSNFFWTAPQEGNYVLQVTQQVRGTASEIIMTTWGCLGSEIDGGLINCGDSLMGNLSEGVDFIHYNIEPILNQPFQINVNTLNGDLDPIIELHVSANFFNPLVVDDDSGVGLNSSINYISDNPYWQSLNILVSRYGKGEGTTNGSFVIEVLCDSHTQTVSNNVAFLNKPTETYIDDVFIKENNCAGFNPNSPSIRYIPLEIHGWFVEEDTVYASGSSFQNIRIEPHIGYASSIRNLSNNHYIHRLTMYISVLDINPILLNIYNSEDDLLFSKELYIPCLDSSLIDYNSNCSQLAFASDRDGNFEIYTINSDGTDLRNLSNSSGTIDAFPDWSANGGLLSHTLSFSSDRVPELRILRPDGSVYGHFRDDLYFNNWIVDAHWSPIRQEIIFINQDADLYLGNTENETIRLTDSVGTFEDEPSWSPDGNRIAFVSASNLEDDNDIFILNRNTGQLTQLTDNSAEDDSPSWSPDGNQIAFHSNRNGNFNIFLYDFETNSTTEITNNSESDLRPSWSPDGNQIAFASLRDGNYEIYIMDADGSNVSRLTNNPATDDNPVWRPCFPDENYEEMLTDVPRVRFSQPALVYPLPNESLLPIGRANVGIQYEVIAKDYTNSWLKIGIPENGISGWIQRTENVTDNSQIFVVPRIQEVALPQTTVGYTGAGNDTDIYGEIRANLPLEVLGRNESAEWVALSYDSDVVWVCNTKVLLSDEILNNFSVLDQNDADCIENDSVRETILRDCTIESITVFDLFANGAINGEVLGEGCDSIIQITNDRNFWVNLDISVVGDNIELIPEDYLSELMDEYGVLPPNSSIFYEVRFSQPNQTVSALVDISPNLSENARMLNYLHSLLQLLSLTNNFSDSQESQLQFYEFLLENYSELRTIVLNSSGLQDAAIGLFNDDQSAFISGLEQAHQQGELQNFVNAISTASWNLVDDEVTSAFLSSTLNLPRNVTRKIVDVINIWSNLVDLIVNEPAGFIIFTADKPLQLEGNLPLQYALMSQLAYYPDDPTIESILSSIGWRVLDEFESFAYYGVALRNIETDEVVIAHRGTNLSINNILGGIQDIIDDALLVGGYETSQYTAAEDFTEDVCSTLIENFLASDLIQCKQSIIHTGHSLGGYLAELIAFRHQASALTFDSPGTGDEIETERAVGFLVEFDITTYVGSPNLVNTSNTHAGLVYLVDTDWEALWEAFSDIRSIEDGYLATYHLRSHSLDRLIYYLNRGTRSEVSECWSNDFSQLVRDFEWLRQCASNIESIISTEYSLVDDPQNNSYPIVFYASNDSILVELNRIGLGAMESNLPIPEIDSNRPRFHLTNLDSNLSNHSFVVECGTNCTYHRERYGVVVIEESDEFVIIESVVALTEGVHCLMDEAEFVEVIWGEISRWCFEVQANDFNQSSEAEYTGIEDVSANETMTILPLEGQILVMNFDAPEVWLRNAPSFDSSDWIVEPSGTSARILDQEPVFADGLLWYQVEIIESGNVGWIEETLIFTIDTDAQVNNTVTNEFAPITQTVTIPTISISYEFEGTSGESVVILLTSPDFDTVVQLWHEDNLLMENDDGAGRYDSIIRNFTLPETGAYRIEVLKYDAVPFTGEFSLIVNSGNIQIASNGIGQSNSGAVTNGEFQVEYFCSDQGYGIRNDDDNWYCTNNGSDVYTLTLEDFYQICRDTYNTDTAIALNNGNGSIPAYRWVCYDYINSAPINVTSVSSLPINEEPPSVNSETCGLLGNSFFVAGNNVVVDFNNDGALRLIRAYDSTEIVTLAQYYDNAEIQLLEGPNCYNDIWYWRVYNERLNAYGWIAEGRGNDRFLCPTSNPECS